MLHLVSSREGLSRCAEVFEPRDVVLLLSDSAADPASVPFPCLTLDADAGPESEPSGGNGKVSYREFIDLTVRHSPVVTWR